MKKKKESSFKIYEDGQDYAAELKNGQWRVMEHNEVKTYEQKPSRFQEFTLMTREEILETDVSNLFEETIRAKWTMDGANTLKEAAQKLRNYADKLEDLNSKGWELRYKVEDDYGFIELELKPDN